MPLTPTVSDKDHAQGPADAPIVLATLTEPPALLMEVWLVEIVPLVMTVEPPDAPTPAPLFAKLTEDPLMRLL